MIFPDYPDEALKKGDRGRNVRIMQAAMNILFAKYPVHDDVVEDGVFSQDLHEAVCDIQSAINILNDGIIESKTWNSILAVASFITEP